MDRRVKKKGFSLIEVLLSGTIIVMILAATVFIGKAAMQTTTKSVEKIQASYLAQEGLEIARQIRDTNWIDEDDSTKWNYLELVTFDEKFHAVDNFGRTEKYSVYTIQNPVGSTKRFGLDSKALFSDTLYTETNLADDTKKDKVDLNGVTFTRFLEFESPTDIVLPDTTNNLSSPNNDFANNNAQYIQLLSVIGWGSSSNLKSLRLDTLLSDWRLN